MIDDIADYNATYLFYLAGIQINEHRNCSGIWIISALSALHVIISCEINILTSIFSNQTNEINIDTH